MKIKVEDYFANKYKSAYKIFHKGMQRYMVNLIAFEGTRTTISYAKYVYMSYHKVDIIKGDEIDHIDDNKLNDDIENLRIVSSVENSKKKTSAKMIYYKCDFCKCDMLIPKRLLTYKTTITCSRSCGGKISHITKKEKVIRGS